MRKILTLAFLVASAYAQVVNPSTSNGPGCTATSSPPYCSGASPVITTDAGNVGAITTTTDILPTNINISDITSLLYAGAAPKILFHFQDWWGCSGHMNIGQTGSNSSLIAAQAATMVGYNGSAVVIDWAGNRDAGKACRLAVTNAWATYLSGHFPTVPLRMAIMIDGGGLTAACPTGATDQTACLTTELNAENDYVNTNYSNQTWYLLDAGRPLVFYFIAEGDWSGTNWTTVWSAVKTHTNAYSNPPKFLFEDTQTHTQGDGGYAWMANPQTYTATKQLWWGSPSGTTPTDYSGFYAACLSHPSNVCVGMVKKGFDDGIGFGGGFTGKNRVQAQRCGQTVLDTANLIGSSGFSSSTQIGYVGIPYNDYEEGTEMETGIDNCYSISASITGTTLNWSTTALDATYSSSTTIDHMRVVYCSTSCTVAVDSIPFAASGNTSLVSIPAGSWTVYMQALGKPMVVNQRSSGLAFTSSSSSVNINGNVNFSGGIVIK